MYKGKYKSAGKLPDGTKLVWRFLNYKHNKTYRITQADELIICLFNCKNTSNKEEGEKMAKKSKYEELVAPKLDTIEGLYREGWTLAAIANFLGISERTLCNYKNQYKELADALKRGNDDAVYAVENALLRSALGFTYEEEEINKKTGQIEVIQKYAKPNVNAQIFFLKNRARNKWKDKVDHEVDATVAQVIFEGEDDIKDQKGR